jgi:hypothetical protein
LGAEGRQFESDRPDQCFQCFAELWARSSAFGTDAPALKGAPLLAFRFASDAKSSTSNRFARTPACTGRDLRGQVKSIIETKANFSGSSATNPQERHNSRESMPKMEIPDDV